MDYKHKYLKYKIKYLNAKQKNIIGGSDVLVKKNHHYLIDFRGYEGKMGVLQLSLKLPLVENDDFSDDESNKSLVYNEHKTDNPQKRARSCSYSFK